MSDETTIGQDTDAQQNAPTPGILDMLGSYDMASVHRGGGGGASARTGLHVTEYVQKSTGKAAARVAIGADYASSMGIERKDKLSLGSVKAPDGRVLLIVAREGAIPGARTFSAHGAPGYSQRTITSANLLDKLSALGVNPSRHGYDEVVVDEDLSTSDILVGALS